MRSKCWDDVKASTKYQPQTWLRNLPQTTPNRTALFRLAPNGGLLFGPKQAALTSAITGGRLMANSDSERWYLPEALDIKKSPLVKAQAEQMRRDLEKRAVSPFARLSPQEFAKVRARARIEHLVLALNQVDQEIRTNRGREQGQRLQEARSALAARLAENFAVLGNLALAAEIHPDAAHRAEYAKQFRKEVETPL